MLPSMRTPESSRGWDRIVATAMLAERAGFHGVYVGDHVLHPRPLLVAGRRSASLARAARLGDGWVGYLISVNGFARARQTLIAERERLGLDPATFVHSMLVPVRIDDRDEGAKARASAAWSGVTA